MIHESTPPKTNMSCKKKDYFSREYIWTKHWFSGDMLVFRGVNEIAPLVSKQKPFRDFEDFRSSFALNFRRWISPSCITNTSQDTLPETNTGPENGWLEDWFTGWPILRDELLVSGSVYIFSMERPTWFASKELPDVSVFFLDMWRESMVTST